MFPTGRPSRMAETKSRRRTCTTCNVEKGHVSFFSGNPVCKVCTKAKNKVPDVSPELEQSLALHVAKKLSRKELARIARDEAKVAVAKRRKVTAAQKELAARLLSRRRLMPFIRRMN